MKLSKVEQSELFVWNNLNSETFKCGTIRTFCEGKSELWNFQKWDNQSHETFKSETIRNKPYKCNSVADTNKHEGDAKNEINGNQQEQIRNWTDPPVGYRYQFLFSETL